MVSHLPSFFGPLCSPISPLSRCTAFLLTLTLAQLTIGMILRSFSSLTADFFRRLFQLALAFLSLPFTFPYLMHQGWVAQYHPGTPFYALALFEGLESTRPMLEQMPVIQVILFLRFPFYLMRTLLISRPPSRSSPRLPLLRMDITCSVIRHPGSFLNCEFLTSRS